MALDEHEYHSYQLPESVKEKRLQELKKRFENSEQPKRSFFRWQLAPPRGHDDWTVIYLSLAFIFLLIWIIF